MSMQVNKKKGNKMAALATAKKNSYIVKKDSAEKIIDSKLSKTREKTIMENAAIFARNNIVKSNLIGGEFDE